MGGAGFPPCCVSLWLLLCPWTWGVLLGEVQGLPVNDCPAASCDSGALARGSESTSFYSAILVNREEEMPHHADDATPRKATQRSTRLGQEAERLM